MLFLNGRGDMIEKYLEAYGHWSGLGWEVTTFDWRGQGGSQHCSVEGDSTACDEFSVLTADLAGLWQDWRDKEGRRGTGRDRPFDGRGIYCFAPLLTVRSIPMRQYWSRQCWRSTPRHCRAGRLVGWRAGCLA